MGGKQTACVLNYGFIVWLWQQSTLHTVEAGVTEVNRATGNGDRAGI
jgi:hypothetical protein